MVNQERDCKRKKKGYFNTCGGTLKFFFFSLFIFGCAGSLLLCDGFLFIVEHRL